MGTGASVADVGSPSCYRIGFAGEFWLACCDTDMNSLDAFDAETISLKACNPGNAKKAYWLPGTQYGKRVGGPKASTLDETLSEPSSPGAT